jgi:N-acetylglucosamine-6-phosphate deacetylase
MSAARPARQGRAIAKVIAAARVVSGDLVLEPGWVEWAGPTLLAVGGGAPPRAADLEASAATVTPGFVDIHAHGGGGAEFGADAAAALRARECHRAHGTTTMLASLVTAPADELERSVRMLAELVADGTLGGIHLEGPWLSAAHRGAHRAALLHPPTAAEVARLLAAGGGAVRCVTLAPELAGGLDAIRRVVDAGAVAAVGHTDATYATARAALDAGARLGTHLFNAMRPVHHREPGAALALLEHPAAHVEIIADGVHLHPAVVRAAATGAAGPVLVTDAMAAAGAPDGGYRLGGLDVEVRGRVARLRGSDTIAGSTLTLDAAVRYAVRHAGLPLLDAVRAATAGPAAVLGRIDIGRLVPGARADLVVLDEDLRVTRVLHAGNWV